MPGSNTTRFTPEQVRSIASNHDKVAAEIEGQQTTLRGNINTMAGANKGAMIDRLVIVHERWDKTTKDIVLNLRDMARTLRSVAEALQQEDQQNASTMDY